MTHPLQAKAVIRWQILIDRNQYDAAFHKSTMTGSKWPRV